MWWVHHQHYLYSKNVNAVANMYSAKPGWQIFHCIFLCIKYGFQCFKEKRDRKTTTRKAKKKKKWHINSRYLSCCKKKEFWQKPYLISDFFHSSRCQKLTTKQQHDILARYKMCVINCEFSFCGPLTSEADSTIKPISQFSVLLWDTQQWMNLTLTRSQSALERRHQNTK